MPNNEFKNIDDFIEGFTRDGPTPKEFIYDGVIYGMDFLYRGKIYRVTRDTISHFNNSLREKFNKTDRAFILFFEIPVCEYPCINDNVFELHKGIFYDVFDLLNNGEIEGVFLKDIISSSETKILSID